MNEELAYRAKVEIANFLQRSQWDAFFTVTFAKPARFPRLAIDRVIQDLQPCSKAFLAAEAHRLGNYHVHGLVRYRYGSEFCLDSLLARLSKRGFSRLEAIRSETNVASYCSKYIIKGQSSDWDFLGNKTEWDNLT